MTSRISKFLFVQCPLVVIFAISVREVGSQNLLDTIPDSIQRTWRDSTGKFSTEARFVSLASGTVTLAKENERQTKVPFDRLSKEDQKYVMDLTGWGRVWQDSDGNSFVADFLQLEGDDVVFEFTNGEHRKQSLASLSRQDQDYVRNRTSPTIVNSPEFEGEVVAITDGDTIVVLVNGTQVKVRLNGVDAPERGQAFGTRARDELADLCMRKQALVLNRGRDKYGKVLGDVYVGELNVIHEMLRRGVAWHYKQYSNDSDLAALELQAKENKAGLWNEPNPVEPWEWRRWGAPERKKWLLEHSESAQPRAPPKPDSVAPPLSENSQTYWLNSSSGVRHNRSCRWFANTKSGRYCGPDEGKACGQCGG